MLMLYHVERVLQAHVLYHVQRSSHRDYLFRVRRADRILGILPPPPRKEAFGILCSQEETHAGAEGRWRAWGGESADAACRVPSGEDGKELLTFAV